MRPFFCISVTVHNSDHSADHQKLNVIQKQILFFDDLGGLFCFFSILVNVFCSDRSADDLVVFWQSSACLLTVFCLSSASLLLVFCWSSGNLLVDHQKMNILFFDNLGGHFFAFQSPFTTQITQPIIRS